MELKFHFLDFPLLRFFFGAGARRAGPQQVFDPMSQHGFREVSMCGLRKLLLHVTE